MAEHEEVNTSDELIAQQQRAPRAPLDEEQLRRNRDTFYNLIQNNPFGVYVVDADFRLAQVSLGSQKVFSHVPRPLLGRNFAEVLRAIWTEPFATEAIARFRHTLDTGEPYAAPSTIERRQDTAEVEAYDWRIERVTLPDGRFGVVCYFYDLSERQRFEAALRESDERARLLVDAARQLGSSLDPEAIYTRLRETIRSAMPLGGLVVSSYDAAEGMIRCTYAWVSGKALDPASLPPLRFNPDAGGMQTQVIRTGKPLLFNDVVERVRDPRGKFYEVNPDGSMRDLQKTGPANVRSAIMVPVLSEGAVVGVVQVMSNSEHAFTNRDLALLEGITLQLGVALENARLYRRAHEELEERKRVEVRLRDAKEAAEAASRAKGDFLATLSHELRTPLTPVLLTVSLLENHPALADELREDVATIRRNVELESRLISDLLDLTRIERGKLQLDERDVDLHLVVRAAADICQREASAKLSQELTAKRHTVDGDATRLQQVFWNLINNAIKFTPRHGTITVRSANTDDGRVRVEVSDTGAGIDPDVLPRLFNAFEQGEGRAARQQAGLGLGLAISKKLAEAHGGTISVASEGRGRGATFAVELPVVGRFVRATSPPERPPLVRSAAQPLKVLLVEDHEPTLRVLERLLRQIGHRVTGVTSVASATAAARQGEFDLIISDLGLPDGSGLDVMRQNRERFAGRAIALTGYGMESDIAASAAAGFAEHLTKPVDLTALDVAIRRVTTQRVDDT